MPHLLHMYAMNAQPPAFRWACTNLNFCHLPTCDLTSILPDIVDWLSDVGVDNKVCCDTSPPPPLSWDNGIPKLLSTVSCELWSTIWCFLLSCAVLPVSSTISAVTYLTIVARWTGVWEPFFNRWWIWPAGNWRQAMAERNLGLPSSIEVLPS